MKKTYKNIFQKSMAIVLLLIPIKSMCSTDFLEKSKILKKNEADLIPAQRGRTGNILLVSESSLSKFAVTNTGLQELEVVRNAKSEKMHIHTCGDEAFSKPYRMKSKESGNVKLVVAVKKLGKLKMRFESMKSGGSRSIAKYCISSKTSFSTKTLSTGVAEDLILYYREWKKDKKFSEACEESQFVDEVGISKGKDCKVLLSAGVDCEGQGYKKGRLGRPMGILHISDDLSQEDWVIFEATGYEGDAILGIQLNKSSVINDDEIDFFIYSGC